VSTDDCAGNIKIILGIMSGCGIMGSFYRINHYLMKDNGNVFLIYWALFLVFYTPAQESFSLEPSHFVQ
jgi:hypothetical protein